ncbi:VCBS domain-containing protein [Martelella mediterranea]|uniref:VCBS repeat-containing protein n=1 Tax=Martelella mediterranea TaxID=293089 RepID=A0A4R3NL44_9HYPH|nr:VCBS domain-containing protein [Martelella mediterranea]TCT34759.1 VCBS repeat-containing protein [Martelella mediterranea]
MQVVVSTVAAASSTATTSTLAGASGVVNAEGLSSLALGVDVTQVSEYIRSGNDLLIVLENGEIITVNGYFAAAVPPDLYLMDGLEAVEAGMEGAIEGAVHPQFSQVANMAADPAVSAMAQASVATGSVSGGLIAGGLAVAAGAGAAIAVSSSDDDDDSVDSGGEPPEAPPVEQPLTLSNLSVLQNEDGSLKISGLATPGTVAHITLSDGTQVDSYVGDDGMFTVVWTPDNTSLPNGMITVHISDGERTSEPGTIDYVDTLAPEAPVIAHLLTDAGMLAEGVATADTTVGLTGTGEVGATITLYAGNGALIGQTSVADDGRWTFDYTGEALEDGFYSVTAVQTDVNGNASGQSESFDFTVDTTSPAALNFEMTDTLGTETGLVGEGDTTDDPRPQITGTAEPGARITMLLNGAPFATTMAHEITGEWEIALEQDIPAGTHNVTFMQTDAAGNSSPVSAQSFTRSNNSPDIDENSGTTGAVSELVAGDPGEGTDTHTATGSIGFNDHDRSDEHIVAIAENGINYLGDLTASVNGETGAIDWTFTVNDVALTYLGEGETRNQTYTLTLDDQNGATDTVDITVTMTGSNDAPVVSASSVLSGALTDPGTIEYVSSADENGILSVTAKLTPEIGATLLDLVRNGEGDFNSVFTSVINDLGGDRALAIAMVWDTVNRAYYDSSLTDPQKDYVNEASARTGIAYASYLKAGGTPLVDVIAQYKPDDDDANDTPERVQTLHDNLLGNIIGTVIAGRFDDPLESELIAAVETIDPDFLTRVYASGNEGTESTKGVQALEFDIEHGIAPTVTGKVSAIDPDASGSVESYSVGESEGTYGALTIDSDTGEWIYLLDTDGAMTSALAEGETAQDVFTVTVTDDQGATTETQIAITVTGSNDAPVLDVASAIDDSLQFNSQDDLDDPAWRGGSWGDINIVNPGDAGYIETPDGTAHGLISPASYFGPYNFFDAYRYEWTGGWIVETSVYLDTNWQDGEGFDYTSAAWGSDATHQRDFVFHVLKDNGGLYISGNNNAGWSPTPSIVTGPSAHNYEIVDSGWYTLQHLFYEQDGYLAVDLNLVDASGNILFTETRTNTTQDGIENIGSNGYSWFTYSTVADGLAIDGIDLNLTGVQPGVREMSDGAEGEGVTMLTSSGSIAYSDADSGDSHTVSISANGEDYYGALTAVVNAGNGTVDWHFEVLDADIEFLDNGVNMTQSYTLTLMDSEGGVDTTEVLVTLRGRNDAPEISGETSGAIMQVGDLAGVNEADADGGLTTDVTISGATLAAWSATLADPDPVKFATFYSSLLEDTGNDVALAIATAWDMQDAAYADQANGTPEINTNGVYIGVEYAQYLEGGGSPLLGVTAKYTPDNGDAGVSPQRVQSLHDNLLGNISGGAFTLTRFVTQDIIDELKAYVADNTSTSIANALGVPNDPAVDGRPYISGNENEDDTAGRSWDSANGYGAVATGQLIATDIDDGHSITWSVADSNGTYGTLMIDDSGKWTYVLDTESSATRALGLNGQGSDTFTVIAEDDFGLEDQVEVTVTVNGNYQMQVVTGDDDDRIVITQDGFEHILAGGGTDTLVLADDGIDIDFTQLSETQVMGIEIIDMDNGGANTLTFDASDIIALLQSSETGDLYIAGDDQDNVALSSGFAKQGASQVIDEVSYALYSNGSIQLHIDDDIDVAVAAGV